MDEAALSLRQPSLYLLALVKRTKKKPYGHRPTSAEHNHSPSRVSHSGISPYGPTPSINAHPGGIELYDVSRQLTRPMHLLKRQIKPSTRAKYPELKYTIDEERCKMLVDAAHRLPCVFHRAFDPIVADKRWAKGVNTLV